MLEELARNLLLVKQDYTGASLMEASSLMIDIPGSHALGA